MNTECSENIFDTGFDFVSSFVSAPALSSAARKQPLMHSIEGEGEPRVRDRRSRQLKVFFGKADHPNVENMGNVPQIIPGADWFRFHGHGEVQRHEGLRSRRQDQQYRPVEIPMGTTLVTIFDIGGSIPNGKKFKAAQTGG